MRSEAGDGTVRLSMLETVREHALSATSARAADSTTCASAMPSASSGSRSTPRASSRARAQAAWLDRLELEFDNIAAALDWLLSSAAAEDALRAIVARSSASGGLTRT